MEYIGGTIVKCRANVQLGHGVVGVLLFFSVVFCVLFKLVSGLPP